MPNLKQILDLKRKFGLLNDDDEKIESYIEDRKEAEILIKAFESGRINESLEFKRKLYSFLNESVQTDKPEIIKYFEEGKEEEVTLLFIDITSFSKTIQNFDNVQIKSYLDEYYKEIIPIIYEFGGEIEKLMGDGIICLFGRPFMDLSIPFSVYEAERCAHKVIKKFHGTNKNVKVAIHIGKVHYYKVPSEDYSEYTMIGQPITDLYRLESVSSGNAINFFATSRYDNLGWSLSIFEEDKIVFKQKQIPSLQGVTFSEMKMITFPNYL